MVIGIMYSATLYLLHIQWIDSGDELPVLRVYIFMTVYLWHTNIRPNVI